MATNEWTPETMPGVEVWRRNQEWYRNWLRRRGYDPDSTSSMWKSLAVATNPEHVEVLLDTLRVRRLTPSQSKVLRSLCTFPSNEVQNSAMSKLVGCLPRRQSAELLRELITEPKCRIKYFLYSKLADIGFRQDVPLLVGYVRTMLTRRKDRGISDGAWDGCDICSFLDEFIRVDPRVVAFYEWIDSRHDLLEKFDLESLRRRQPYFGHHSGRRWVLMISDDRLGACRVVNAVANKIPGLGTSSLLASNPRFRSALRVLGEEADLILVVGDKLADRVRRLATAQTAPMHTVASPKYEHLIDYKRGGWATVHEGEFRRVADKEDAEILRRLRPIITRARVRHKRPLRERLK